jgi:4-amino-4-deoxy-L-arabinose transferase-like glycosyltransferase
VVGRSRGAKLSRAIVWASSGATFAAALVVGATARYRVPFEDESVYRRLSYNLLHFHFFGSTRTDSLAYRAPGYPFFETAIRAFNDSATAVRVAQAVVAALAVWLTAEIARRLFGDLAAAVSAVALLAVGTIAVYASFELSETLSTTTLLAAVAVLLAALDARNLRLLGAAGALAGISTLARPQTLFLMPLLAVAVAWRWGAPARAALRAAAVLVAGAVLVVMPWTIRNAVKLHAFVPVSDYGGVNLYLSNNPHADGLFRRANVVVGEKRYDEIVKLPEAAQDRKWYAYALGYIAHHPGATLRHWTHDGRLYLTLLDDLMQRFALTAPGRKLPYADDRLLWPLAFAGILAAAFRKDRGRALVPAVVVAYFVVFFMVFLPLPRFRHGVIPFLAVYAGALAAAGARLGTRARRGTVPEPAEPHGIPVAP